MTKNATRDDVRELLPSLVLLTSCNSASTAPLQSPAAAGSGFGSAVFINEVNNQRRDDNQQYDNKMPQKTLQGATGAAALLVAPAVVRCSSPPLAPGRGGGGVVDQWRRALGTCRARYARTVEAFLVQMVAQLAPGRTGLDSRAVFEAYGAPPLRAAGGTPSVRRAVDAVGEAGTLPWQCQ